MRFVRVAPGLLLLLSGCDLFPRPGDTDGLQRAARWYAPARIVVDTDPRYTIVRLRADTTAADGGGHDVLIARFDFDPAPGAGDEYSISLAFDFCDARDLD